MTRYQTVAKLLACLVLVVATLRAFAFWAADPMLAYANNSDQIRTLRVFGLHPKDSPVPLYAMTPEAPLRYFVHADTWHAPTYPSSDLLFKAVQYAAMAAFRASDGAMDIKIASAPMLAGWLLGIWLIFRRLAAKPLAALGFAGWILLVADPVNLLFVNTLYAEFSAFALITLFVGMAWLWLFQLVSLRSACIWSAVCLAVISFNRNQYMFLLPAVALLAGAALVASGPRSKPSAASAGKWALIAIACLLPVLTYSAAAKKRMYIETATNRTNTVFIALLPASKDPARMMQRMGLPPECARFIGENLHSRPIPEFEAHCPQSMRLSLVSIAKAVALEPAPLATILWNVAQRHRGFLQPHIGHIEGMTNARLQTTASVQWHHQSMDLLVRGLSARGAVLLIYLVALGPVLAALVAWGLRQRRWAFMFLLNGLLFNYVLFSSILGDGYSEVERHAVLCFSFGALFFVLLASFIASARFSARTLRSPAAQTAASV